MSSSENNIDGVPFSFFISLLREVAQSTRPRTIYDSKSKQTSLHNYPARSIFCRWITELRRRFGVPPPGTTAAVFRLLFPEDDVHRKYGMQEHRLLRSLADCLGLDVSSLAKWATPAGDATTSPSGCLGIEVRKLLECGHSNPEEISSLSILKVDELLNELAAGCAFSDPTIRTGVHYPRRRTVVILRDLYRNLPPTDAGFMTQIILKDLRPILYPIPDVHYATALLSYNTESARMLSREDAMWSWDPTGRMFRAFRASFNLDRAAEAYECLLGDADNETRVYLGPEVGKFFQLPKSEKARDPKHAVQMLSDAKQVWAETKYDGERAQIHVALRRDGSPHITIFSKSQRNSTWDRVAVHPYILQALNLGGAGANSGRYRQTKRQIFANIVLDAEMVAYRDDYIDEFWRIRGLIESTAQGVRGRKRVGVPADSSQCALGTTSFSQSSLASDISDNQHLALVFFDILMVDSVSLLGKSYAERRELLESFISPIPHYAMLAERVPLEMTRPLDSLCTVFGANISNRKEGLVLKAEESVYGDRALPWVKAKRDYIPGYGDCVDLLVLGAGWDKERAMDLRVPVDTFTTFYIGALSKESNAKHGSRPHFHIFFTVAYGLTREQLEEANFLLKSSDSVRYPPSASVTSDLPYTFSVFGGLKHPRILLFQPLVAELFGAGFTKAPKAKQYELRFPRITKIHRHIERSWECALTLVDFHKLAREVVGRDRQGKDLDDWCKTLWGKTASPSVQSAGKRKRLEDEWVRKLRRVSGLPLIRDRSEGEEESEHDADATIERQNGHLTDDTVQKSPVGRRRHQDKYRERARSSVRKIELASDTDEPVVHPGSSPLTQKTNLPVSMPSQPEISLSLMTKTTGHGFAINIPKVSTDGARTPTGRKKMSHKHLYPSPFTSPVKSSSQNPDNHRTAMASLAISDGARGIDDLKDPALSCRGTPKGISGFIADSLVCIAKTRRIKASDGHSSRNADLRTGQPSSGKKMVRRRKLKEDVVPSGQKLHSLESLLVGCGWAEDTTRHVYEGCQWVNKGVIFVEDEAWLSYVRQAFTQRKAALGGRVGSSKPIWVFDIKMMNHEHDAVEEGCLCKLE
ncbi:hypothetical protein HGRIS_004641 [Hohenbuehelia grisea]|uniref:ATP-dependent DNA ligase family profile domain-containing protein n=1 Tax=Hohenbuehelia grisea TaxID=104357 RepID=A0ABR3JD55_9AGAR